MHEAAVLGLKGRKMMQLGPSDRMAIDIDLLEKVVLITAFSFFALRMIEAYAATRTLVNLLFLLNEACLVVFIVLRRKTQTISRRKSDWLVGFGGTFLPLLLLPASGAPVLPMAACTVLMLAGFFTQFAAKLTLRRSFGVIAANRGVKLSGPYRLVRHPMYAGYMMTQASLLLAGPSLYNLAIIACAWSLQIGRILAEERVLSADERYRELTRATRYRLMPGVF